MVTGLTCVEIGVAQHPIATTLHWPGRLYLGQSVLPSPQHCSPPSRHVSTTILPISLAMSQVPSASTSSSNFQSIFNAALEAYEKKAKTDLLAHPLATQLQACKSPGDILAVLQEKVKELDQSRSADERLSQWLIPTINVLYSFSATLGAGVGLVSTAAKSACLPHPLITDFAGILARCGDLFGYRGPSLGEQLL